MQAREAMVYNQVETLRFASKIFESLVGIEKGFLNEILCRLRFAAQAMCVTINQIDMVSIQLIKSVRLLHGWTLGSCFGNRGAHRWGEV